MKKVANRQCKHCHKTYRPTNGGALYCSKECANVVIICPCCGNSFESIRGRKVPRKYCSYKCNINGNREAVRQEPFYKDRKTYKRLRLIYSLILARCNYKWNKAYKNYGARGIKCEWKSFEEFYDDMAPTHEFGLEVDRLDNDGNYCKSNCKWVTHKQNVSHTRRSRNITLNGETKTLTEWCDIYNIKVGTVLQRLKFNWNYYDAFTKPVNTKCWRKSKS